MLVSNMMRMTLLLLVSLSLTGCPDFPTPTGSYIAPNPSNVAEDASGQKYFIATDAVRDTSPTTQSLYMWNTGTQQWEKKTMFPITAGNQLFVNQAGDTAWVNNEVPSLNPLLKVNLQTGQASTIILKRNQTLVAADKAVEYNGNLVNLYQPSTGGSVYLHSLPVVADVIQGLGVTSNALPYQMLCMPAMKYAQWDNKTHLCALGNDVKYARDIPVPVEATNDVLLLTITVGIAGNTYNLISHDPNYNFTYMFTGSELPVDFLADYPLFSTLYNKQGCGGSVDKQGNYHEFCDDAGDYTKFTYYFYDKAVPTTPLYTQVLP